MIVAWRLLNNYLLHALLFIVQLSLPDVITVEGSTPPHVQLCATLTSLDEDTRIMSSTITTIESTGIDH